MLAGVLVDVSGSMRNTLQPDLKLEDEPVSRAQTIFSTIINIAQDEVDHRDDQQIFALAFGLEDVAICDLLALLDYLRTLTLKSHINGHEPLIKLLQNNGAPYAGEYIKKYVAIQAAGVLFETYSQNRRLLKELIDKLPAVCKNRAVSTAYSTGKTAYSAGKTAYSTIRDSMFSLVMDSSSAIAVQDTDNSRDTESSQETESSRNTESSQETQNADFVDREEKIAREHVDSALRSSIIIKLKSMSMPKEKSLEFVVSLLRDVAMMSSSSNSLSPTTQPLSAAQLSSLVNSIEKYIFGGTPMCEALRCALHMFHSAPQNLKVLFLLTDGESADGNPAEFARQFHDRDIYVFGCLLTSENISDPRRLYDSPDSNWPKAQRTLFELCTTISNMHPAMSILLEQNWKLPESGQSRLFLQANHRDVINEFYSLVREMGKSNDVLLNMLGRASLDMHINSSNSSFEPIEQEGETCYACAVATVFYLAMCRIEGREGGVPDFKKILQTLIETHGTKCAKTEKVIKQWGPTYRLRYAEVTEREARLAIIARRPVVATFRLNKSQWEAFDNFYKNKPQGILEGNDLGTGNSSTPTFGHAVVLIRCDPTSLTFMNWRGTHFADEGFFKVQNQSVLNLCFYDVYWKLEDLKESEIAAFQAKSNKIGQSIMQKLPESVQNLLYECPECNQSSRAFEFTGDLQQATCPKCNKTFNPVATGLIQSLRRR